MTILYIHLLYILVSTTAFSTSRICPKRLPHYGYKGSSRSDDYEFYNGESSEEMYWEKYQGTRNGDRELRDIEYPEKDFSLKNGGDIQKYREDYYDDEPTYYYEEEEEEEEEDDEEEEPEPGNFWSNPSGKMDRAIPRRRRDRSQISMSEERDYIPDRSDRRRRSSRRRPLNGTGQRGPPKPAKNFYERLFWYGFDPDESEGVGDKTVFGGTKGKFNGLSYLAASEGQQFRRQLPPSNRNDESYYYDDEADMIYEEDEDTEQEFYEISESQLRSVKPPNDFPYPRSEPLENKERRSRRRQRRRSEIYDGVDDDNDSASDWITKSVSTWFTGEENEYDYDGDSSTRGQRRRRGSDWSPFNVVDAFFGVDRDEMEYKADLYNEKMGLRKSSRSPSRRRRSSSQSLRDTPSNGTRRPGYAYRYDGNDNDSSTVVDLETTVDVKALENDENESNRDKSNQNKLTEETKKNERSWEERALAVERVPPADIPAWGPSGELPYDARTKAIMDALEDIQTAVQKVEAKEKKEALAREEITVLKVDAELQRRKLKESRGDPRFAQEQLRQIEFELDDASRALRRARTKVGLASQQLDKFRDRHWALLSFYNPEQAKEKVDEALNEFQEIEPAARLDKSYEPTQGISMESSSLKQD